MSSSVSKSSRLSFPLKVEEEAPKIIQKQGIVSILGSDCERTKAPSLRRTLSADMSSKKWLAQNGFSPMKKIASFEELTISAADSSSSSDGEEEYEGKNELKSEKKELETPGQSDIWASILSQKAEDSSKLLPPYIPPLVKRSSSSLNERSLEICTENLGSETGSDGFSSYPPSENGEIQEEKEEIQQQQEEEEKEYTRSFDMEEVRVVKYNYFTTKESTPKSFPPPLPSRARSDGPSLQMHSHRKDGRLVLEAVTFLQRNCFHAHRQEGRLLLTLVNSPSQEPSHEEMEDGKAEDFVRVFDNFEEVEDNEAKRDEEYEVEEEEEEEGEEEEEEEKVVRENGKKEMGFVIEQAPKLTSGVISVHRSALMMKKLMGIDNRRNPIWPNNFNKAVFVDVEEEEEELNSLPHSLPPPPRVARMIPSSPPAAAASFNAYEYFWRTKPTVASVINPITQQCLPLKTNYNNNVVLSNNQKAYEQQNLVLLRGNNEDYFIPLLKGCKKPRRSILLWEPNCIATS